MNSEKKRSKEDTWKAADLKRYIAEGGHGDDRRGDRGDSLEKHYKESRREGDKHRNYYIGGRGGADEMYRHVERRKEGSQDRRDDRERNRRDERIIEKERRRERDRVDLSASEHIQKTDRRRRDREETQERERDHQRQREKDKYTDEERVRRRQEREKEVRREEGEWEYKHYRDRRSHENTDKGGSEYTDKYNRERRERHRERDRQGEEYGISRSEKERRERHAERKQSERKEGKEYQDDQRKGKDDRERRHKEQRHHKHHSESREHRDRKRTEEEVRHHRSDREAEPRGDKHTERRHKEEKDPKEHFKERTQEGGKELQQTSLGHTQKAEETKIVNENEPEQEYEDDFEEYEDDFEELDESDNEGGEKEELVEHKEELSPEKREEIKAIQRAMDEENKKVGALSRQNTTEIEEERPKWSRESQRTESQTSQRGKFMDFVAAKQREVNKKVASKQKKRSTELLRLIDLDFTLTSSLLDLPPVNEYDMYIRNFGTANTKQVYVQCNEDNADRDIQTEEIELTEKWTQHPAEHSGACGDPNISPKTRDGPLNELNIDTKRLTTFLQSASQVMIVLLEEDQAERNSLRKLKTQTDVLSFSDGSLQLNSKLPFLQGYHISLIHFSEVQKHTMISVHTSTTKPSAGLLGNHTLICIWNIWEPSRPQKILLYESEVQCCCFSPGKATLVFAGTTVGSVVLWDLREHTSNHYQMTIGDDEWTFRHPSFSTDAVMSASGHFSTVMSVEVVPSAVARGQTSEVSLLAPKEEATGLSFQLASLDESGILNFWVVVELPKTNEAGSPTDLGLRPGGKVKLLHSSTLSVVDRMLHRAKKSAPLQMLQLKFLPTDSNHFFIGTNMGIVHHGTSHGLKALPKFYRYQEGNERPVDINSVGCGDGCIRLHSVCQEKPLIEWRDGCTGQSVVSVQWSQTRPAVFSVLDSASNIYLWDLLKNETKAVITEGMGKDRVTAMALFGDSGQRNTYSGVALAHESGKIEIQYFTNNLTVSSLSELEKLNSLIEAI